MFRFLKWFIPLALLLMIGYAAVNVVPFALAWNTMPTGSGILLRQQQDGVLLLAWRESDSAESYFITVSDPNDPDAPPLFAKKCQDPECLLPKELPNNAPVEIVITSQKQYNVLGQTKIREGSTPISVICILKGPQISDLRSEFDPASKTATLTWNKEKNVSYRLYLRKTNGDLSLLQKTDNGYAVLHFAQPGSSGSGDTFSLPEWELPYEFVLEAVQETSGVIFEGVPSAGIVMTRKDFIGEYEIETHVINASIWPLRDLPVYPDSTKQEPSVGQADAGAAYRILDEDNEMLLISFGDNGEEGWISADYCMINLTDFLGDLCTYDITNSYSSIFMIHGYEIPGVTGTIVPGYENIDQGNGRFLVPLLYPTAKKVAKAALAVIEDGYRLKIYEAYRPNVATRYAYDTANSILWSPLPETTYYGETTEEYANFTYNRLMSNGTYGLSSFLASQASMHNMGIAVDLTLIRIEDGSELEMQSAMHDLSWFSVKNRNNENAQMLEEYMTNVGLVGITSEWWHYQDDLSRTTLGLGVWLREGVAANGEK